jgi:hypothetical protein
MKKKDRYIHTASAVAKSQRSYNGLARCGS